MNCPCALVVSGELAGQAAQQNRTIEKTYPAVTEIDIAKIKRDRPEGAGGFEVPETIGDTKATGGATTGKVQPAIVGRRGPRNQGQPPSASRMLTARIVIGYERCRSHAISPSPSRFK
jgi:hypothetical protein